MSLKSGLQQQALSRLKAPLHPSGITPVIPVDRFSFTGLSEKEKKRLFSLIKRELIQRQTQMYVDTAKEVTLGSVAALIYSGGQVAKETIGGFFRLESSIAANPDPVAQGVSIGFQVAGLVWFLSTPLGKFLVKNLGLTNPPLEGLAGSTNTAAQGVISKGADAIDAEIKRQEDMKGAGNADSKLYQSRDALNFANSTLTAENFLANFTTAGPLFTAVQAFPDALGIAGNNLKRIFGLP